jgi:hypothetical protein
MGTEPVNWGAAEELASRLGNVTCELVATRNRGDVAVWALKMARQHTNYAGNAARAASYRELATLAGCEEVGDLAVDVLDEPELDDAA